MHLFIYPPKQYEIPNYRCYAFFNIRFVIGRVTRSSQILQASPIGGESLDSKSSPVSPPHSHSIHLPLNSPTSSTKDPSSYNLNSSGSGGGHSSSFSSAPSISLFSHGHCSWPGCDTSIIDDASGPFSDASIKAFER